MRNPGVYPAWTYRRKLLKPLEKDISEELKIMTKLGLQIAKNFQIWHHRRCIVEMYSRVVAHAIAEDEEQDEIQIAGSQHQAIKNILNQENLFLEQVFNND